MKVHYDGYAYSLQETGGIIRYFNNIISGLPKTTIPLLTTCESRAINKPKHPEIKEFSYKRFGFRPGRLSFWFEPYYFKAVTCLNKIDIVHPTYYDLLSRQEVGKISQPVVLSVWDMIHENFPDELDPNGSFREIKRKAILSAQKVICISENTKKDLLEFLPIHEDKIAVTHLAAELNVSQSYGSEPIPSQPYFLYVGSRSVYKNFNGFLESFGEISLKYPDLVICIVGPSLKKEEIGKIEELNLNSRVQYYGVVSDNHLAKLYRCSLALVYPSFYEGFGIPVLEAMACEAPVIACNSSSIPEVVGDAGILFDPKSKHSLTDCLHFLLENPAQTERLVEKGRARSKMFNWSKTVEQTMEVYQSLMN